MKISERISSAVKQLKTNAAHELSLIGKAFGRSVRSFTPNSNRVGVMTTPMLVPTIKKAKGEHDVIANLTVKFKPDRHTSFKWGQVSGYDIRASHDDTYQAFHKDFGPVSDHFCCRHMVAMELTRRETEKTHPEKHTKADRAKVFSIKNAAHLATKRQFLERRFYDTMLYTPDAHVFNNQEFGAFLESEFKKLAVGQVKNLNLMSKDHAMALTIKRKEGSYSVSIWDPNYNPDHTKIKFNEPKEAARARISHLLGAVDTKHYTQAGPLFTAYELPEGWAKGKTKCTPEIWRHSYENGGYLSDLTNRNDWVKQYTGLDREKK